MAAIPIRTTMPTATMTEDLAIIGAIIGGSLLVLQLLGDDATQRHGFRGSRGKPASGGFHA